MKGSFILGHVEFREFYISMTIHAFTYAGSINLRKFIYGDNHVKHKIKLSHEILCTSLQVHGNYLLFYVQVYWLQMVAFKPLFYVQLLVGSFSLTVSA